MDITYPFAKVFVDCTNKLNVFFCHSEQSSEFKEISNIGNAVVDFTELDFTEVATEIKKLNTLSVSSEFEKMKQVFWNAVDLLKDKHSYAHFFLNSELLRNFYASDRSKEEQVDYGVFLFQYYINLQADYADALETILGKDVLTEYTLPERYMMFFNLKQNFTRHTLRSMYAIAPIAYGKFDASKLITFQDPKAVDTRKVLNNIHREEDTIVNVWPHFAIQSLEEMLYLELMEMIKRGVLIKRCSLCDKYFVLSDKRVREYCSRIYKDGRTCKQIGAKLKFNKSVDEDTFLQQFQTIYNRMYSRYYRIDAWDSERETNKLSESEFKHWSTVASNLRFAYKQGEVDGKAMIEALEKSTIYKKS